MRVKLRVMKGAQAGREVVIPGSEFVIGRDEDCHLRPRSDAISRKHCAIVVSENQVIVRDLGSRNGSYVNGQRVEGDRVVQAGDQFQVGPLEFEIVTEHALGGAKRPAARDVKEVAARTAASSTEEELDIAGWLEADDGTDVSDEVARPETRQFQVDDTSNLALDTSVDGTSSEESDGVAEEDEDPDSEDDDKKSRWKKSEPGKLPPRPSTCTKDSREAAANMLKRFFNRG